jgi:membrane protein DedA with SNARE-associated domain
MLSHLNDFIIHLIQSMSYPGIFILMFFESVIIPIPSEVTMVYAGQVAQQGHFNFIAVIVTGAFANLTGSMLCYYIGYSIHEDILRKWIGKYGKYILVSTEDFDRAHRWTIKYQSAVSFFSRLMPGIRTIISLPCGIVRIKFLRFCVYTFAGALIWCTFLTYIGYALSKNLAKVEQYFVWIKMGIVIAVIVLIAVYVWRKTRNNNAAN